VYNISYLKLYLGKTAFSFIKINCFITIVQSNKNQELLRNALERSNALKTAKQLLSTELSETTATRDKLINDLANAKKVCGYLRFLFS